MEENLRNMQAQKIRNFFSTIGTDPNSEEVNMYINSAEVAFDLMKDWYDDGRPEGAVEQILVAANFPIYDVINYIRLLTSSASVDATLLKETGREITRFLVMCYECGYEAGYLAAEIDAKSPFAEFFNDEEDEQE